MAVDGKIEIFDVATGEIGLEDPLTFGRVLDFNTVVDAGDEPDDWIESELFAGLDNTAAVSMRSLVATTPRLKSHLKKIKGNGWHPNHLLSPRASAGFAMFMAAQAVRSPSFRAHATRATGRVIERTVREQYSAPTPTSPCSTSPAA